MTKAEEEKRVKSIEKAIRIIDEIQEREGARVTEIADALDLPPSTVHSHVSTLESNKLLVKEGDVYQIGLEFLHKGGCARRQQTGFELIKDKVDEIAEETEERAQFFVEEHGRGVYLHAAEGAHGVHLDARIGKVNYLHATAGGKAILAHLHEQRFEEVMEKIQMEEVTENTLTDREGLEAELEEIRERGYSFNDQESIMGLRAVGVPVKGANGRLIGGLSVSGPSHRLRDSWFWEEIPNLLLGVANEIELNLSYR